MPPTQTLDLHLMYKIFDDTHSHMPMRRDDEDDPESVSDDDVQLSRFSPLGHNSLQLVTDGPLDNVPGSAEPLPTPTVIIQVPTAGLASILSEISLSFPTTTTSDFSISNSFNPLLLTPSPSLSSSRVDKSVAITSTSTTLVFETPTSVQTLLPQPISAESSHGMRLGIILGCTIGGVIILFLFAAIAFLLIRRKRSPDPDAPVFFSERMVQSRPLLPFESTKGKGINPLRRFSRQTGLSFSMITGQNASPMTRDRREEFRQRIEELQTEINGLMREANGEGIMGRIEAHDSMGEKLTKLQWLEAYKDSSWAAGLTDAPPPYYQLYFDS
ncbi:hypothetical protein BDN72DRAFT_835678 [Pluteus cervinus]|uniref:Uncharacterized protein n=1 Tax=Pluteus cervinus TaxID=181527 RepID=A0ACD3B571_9AGAR|nr:hypothetical protein BDN72DRAFT_835678 [Pluteus cervinus]